MRLPRGRAPYPLIRKQSKQENSEIYSDTTVAVQPIYNPTPSSEQVINIHTPVGDMQIKQQPTIQNQNTRKNFRQNQTPLIPNQNLKPPGLNKNIPPEQAAAEFRRVNKTLPDGVRYEPLDDETMKLLRDNGHIPSEKKIKQTPDFSQQVTIPQTPLIKQQAIPQNALHKPSIETPIPSKEQTTKPMPESAKLILENLIQDEHNASIFYSHFANISDLENIKKALATLAKDCLKRIDLYNLVVEQEFNYKHTPKDITINTSINTLQAITLAIVEENNALITLNEFLDIASDSKSEKIISKIINKKLIAHQLLLSLNKIH